jgi:hypothetical protein
VAERTYPVSDKSELRNQMSECRTSETHDLMFLRLRSGQALATMAVTPFSIAGSTSVSISVHPWLALFGIPVAVLAVLKDSGSRIPRFGSRICGICVICGCPLRRDGRGQIG